MFRRWVGTLATVLATATSLVRRPSARRSRSSYVGGRPRTQPLDRARGAPANAQRVTGRTGVHLVTLFGGEVGALERTRTESDRFVVGATWIADVKIEVDLLLLSAGWPLGNYVVGGQLNTDSPPVLSIDDAVPAILTRDEPLEDPHPKGTLGLEVWRIEDDDGANELYG